MKKWITLLVLTLLLIGGTGYLYLQQPAKETPGVLVTPEGQPSSSISLDPSDLATRENREMKVFVGDPKQGRLVQKSVTIQNQQDIIQEITQTVQYLIHPDSDTRNPVIPEGTELLNVFMTNAGIVYLNLNRNLQDRHIGGLTAELATVTSLVNTVLFNFKEVKQVQLLVEGAEIETLAGHIDCRKPFSKMFSLQNL
jgi:germination protein M